MVFIDKNRIKMFCSYEAPKEDAERVLSSDEIKALIKATRIHLSKNIGYTGDYPILMALLTGMRVGELVALRWENIDNDYIHIVVAERKKRYDKHTEIEVGDPKNHKKRHIPITDEIRALLTEIQSFSNGNEWLFYNEDGRLKENAASSSLKRHCKEAGIRPISFHCIRRTVSSYLNTKLPREAVVAMLGHLPTTNERFYDYDISEKADKIKALSGLSLNVINFSTYKEAKKEAKAQ